MPRKPKSKSKLKEFEVVYFELNVLTRTISAATLEEAISQSEAMREAGEWDDCQEDTEGTNGIERVYRVTKKGRRKEMYNSGTTAGFVD